MGTPHGGMAGQGYSYSTLTSSMDLGPVDGPDGRTCRNRAVTNLQHGSRPHVDRRYSPPPPRHRAETTGPSSIYASLQSGLTLPRTAITKGSVQSKDRRTETSSKKDKDKAHSGSRHSANSKPTKQKSKKEQKPKRPERTPPEKKSPRRKSTTKNPEDRRPSRPFSIRSTRSRGTARERPVSVTSKKAASQKSKGKSKGMFGWGCFGG